MKTYKQLVESLNEEESYHQRYIDDFNRKINKAKDALKDIKGNTPEDKKKKAYYTKMVDTNTTKLKDVERKFDKAKAKDKSKSDAKAKIDSDHKKAVSNAQTEIKRIMKAKKDGKLSKVDRASWDKLHDTWGSYSIRQWMNS